ncbi:stringent starvation protein B [Vibrio sp. JCM 19236]|nr:stringent starvation protein B [Vibrio sp. JCM 19236]
MTPRRPYLLRAFYEWLVENELTPHLVVDAMMTGVRVPEEYVQDGQIILNVAPRAVGNLEMSNEAVTFHARFGGRPHSVIVPIYAVQVFMLARMVQVPCLRRKRATMRLKRVRKLSTFLQLRV